jgi:cytidylate kinase
MAVVTVSRELGSEGSLVAKLAAETLGYHLADEGTLEIMLKGYGLVKFDQDYHKIPGFWDRFDIAKNEERDTFLMMLNHSMQALAAHGDVVIVGRGGFAVLAGLADVLNVRVQAPLNLRIERAEDLPSLPEPGRAAGLVKGNDKIQKTFIESVYGVQWDNASSYDLVLDTAKITPELASGLIVESVRALNVPRLRQVRTAADLQVDKVLALTVHEVLHCEMAHV